MVAALGVSIPSQPGCGHYFESAQAWATALLSEWDTWEPDGGDQKAMLWEGRIISVARNVASPAWEPPPGRE